MKKFLVLLPFLLFLTSETMWGQSITQAVKGIVIEKGTNLPLPGVNVVIIGSDPISGAITALSSQVLANSDFYTGAFPAEYANALSGVFDLKMRTGNPDTREFTLQVGVIGLDAAAEGPFVKGKPATFLFNYRYSTLALSGNGMQWYQKRLDSSMVMLPKEDVKVYNYALSMTSSLNHKFGPKHTNKSGMTLNQLFYDVAIKNGETYQDSLIQVANDVGNTTLLQAFSQSMFNPWPGWTINAGLTMQYFTLNGHYTIEPRVGIRWYFHPRHSLGVAYGLHAQLELISFYLMEIQSGEDLVKPNENLDFSKSHHFVHSYDFRINNYFRIKAEPFFQYMFNIPVIPGTPWSAQNISTEWMITDTLVNQGNGILRFCMMNR